MVKKRGGCVVLVEWCLEVLLIRGMLCWGGGIVLVWGGFVVWGMYIYYDYYYD